MSAEPLVPAELVEPVEPLPGEPGAGPRYRSPLLGQAGAVAGQQPDDGVAGHYGDPLREQRALATGRVLVDRSHREVLTVSGPDRRSWLHSLTTQHLEALPVGQGTEALVLSPNGHIEHHLALVDDGTTTWIDVEPGTSATLLAFLDRMRFMLRVELADRTADVAVLTAVDLGGPTAGDAPDALVVRAMPWGTDLLVARDRLSAIVSSSAATGRALAGHDAWEAARVERGRPRLGSETDHRTIPNETPWLQTALHLQKGCYRGQETVARTHNLGRPPRRLVRLQLDGGLPPRDAPVQWEGRTIGRVTTPVYHYELGPIALAVIKRNVPDDVPLVADGLAAAIG